ncbi:MAG TPA: TIGR03619 family F420-dependent LLM class oxidoreductase, partial [Acidimicrobiales bacterium]|nr:TIGR03619 family F420-dependent LLM class oxidoreductase [Acidimicrobiales bacterium]
SMINPSYYVPLARTAEEVGFDAIALADSICYPEQSDSKYPYTPDGNREFLEKKPFLEPLTLIAALSSVTSRIEFLTSVLKLPIRHPVVLGKQVTSVAVLSNDRLQLGVGSSPWPDDYETVGLPWQGRGRRFDECIEILRGLATGHYFSYDGQCYQVPSIKLNPPPTRPIPILIGGQSDANLRRAARIGDGWISAGSTTEQLADWIRTLRQLRRDHRRDESSFAIHATTPDSFSMDGVRHLEEMGVTHTGGGFSSFNPYQVELDSEPLDAKVAALQYYAETVIGPTRA